MSEINEFQHPNSIWTWKSNKRGGKTTLWLPYVSRVEKVKKSAWRFTYNGGEVEADVTRLECVMFYGATGQIPVALIDELAACRCSFTGATSAVPRFSCRHPEPMPTTF